MKAIVCTKYGPPEMLQLQTLKKPVPGNNEVLIKIYAATVTMGDCELRTLTLPAWIKLPVRLFLGYRKPRKFIPGMEFSGVIESVGEKVTALKKNDPVFGMHMGSNTEYICRSATSAMGIKPSGVSFEEAATIPVGGLNALHFLRKANIQPGQKVLVIGAGGSIGTFGIQLAKSYQAEVTAVDSTEKLEMLRAIGADHVIDYTREDFSKNGVKYDVILDMIYKSAFSRCIQALKHDGCYLMANTSPSRMLRGLWVSVTSKRKVKFAFAGESTEDLNYLAGLMASGKIKAVIDKHYPLEKTAEAHAYVENGHKKGNVVIIVAKAP